MLLLHAPEVPDPAPSLAPVRLCASDYCPPSIPGALTDWPWSPTSRYFKMTTTEVQMTGADGTPVWKVAVSSTLPPDLVGRGDFTGDGVPDYVFQEVQPTARRCVGHAMSQTQLVFVDGATGSA